MARYARLGVLVALAAVVVMLAAIVVGPRVTSARATSCVATVEALTADAAATELRRYALALQSDAPLVATYGHINQLLALAEALDGAPRLGCEVTQ